MIHLDLSSDEAKTLSDILESYLSDLRMEIADTDSQDFRELLKERKAVVAKTIESLTSYT
jgi:hypothetical protein